MQLLGEKSCNGCYTLTHIPATNNHRNWLFTYLWWKKPVVIWSLRALLSKFIYTWCPWVSKRGWDLWGSSLLPTPLPIQIMKGELYRETAAAMGPLKEKQHQKCSPSRNQNRLLQPVSEIRSWAHATLISHGPQNPDERVSGQGNATAQCVVLPVHLCSSLDGASLFEYVFP